MECGGGFFSDFATEAALDGMVLGDSVQELDEQIDLGVPELRPEGLDLLGIARVPDPDVVGIRTTEHTAGFDDYMCLVGDFDFLFDEAAGGP
jgi:hypothetical protein